MGASEPDLLARLWEEHLRAPFPARIRGMEFAYGDTVFDMVLLDADIAGCVSMSLSSPHDERRQEVLLVCLAAVESVLPSLGDEDGAFAYYDRLRKMAVLAVDIGRTEVR